MLAVREQVITVGESSKLIKLIEIDGKEGMTLTQAAASFGVDESNIRHILKRASFVHGTNTAKALDISRIRTLSPLSRPKLVEEKVVGKTGRMPSFINKDQIEILVRVINTREANAIYRQLWEIARNKEVAIRHHTELAGETDPSKVFTPDLLQRVLDAWKSEIALKEAAQAKVIELTDAKPLTADQYKATKDLVDKALRNAGYFPAIQLRKHPYAYLMAKFEVPAVAQIPAKRFDEIEVLLSDFKMLPRYHKLYKRFEL